MSSKKTEMSGGCNFCDGCGHTWETRDGKRICFSCLRKQRDENVLTIAYLRESLRQANAEIGDLRVAAEPIVMLMSKTIEMRDSAEVCMDLNRILFAVDEIKVTIGDVRAFVDEFKKL